MKERTGLAKWVPEPKPATRMCRPAKGKKGTKDNPFVILEIVADKAQQQMGYLAMDENETKPLDVLQYGIDTAAEQKRLMFRAVLFYYGTG